MSSCWSCTWNRSTRRRARYGWTWMRPMTRYTVTRGPILSRLLRLLLLLAVIHLLRGAPVVCATARIESRCLSGQHRGARAHRGSAASSLAPHAHPHPGRFGILPGVHPALVRGPRYRLRARIGTQCAPGACHWSSDARSALGTLRQNHLLSGKLVTHAPDGEVGIRADLAPLRFTGESAEPLPRAHLAKARFGQVRDPVLHSAVRFAPMRLLVVLDDEVRKPRIGLRLGVRFRARVGQRRQDVIGRSVLPLRTQRWRDQRQVRSRPRPEDLLLPLGELRVVPLQCDRRHGGCPRSAAAALWPFTRPTASRHVAALMRQNVWGVGFCDRVGQRSSWPWSLWIPPWVESAIDA